MNPLAAVLALFVSAASAGSLAPERASQFARLALRCARKEYPNKPDHVMQDAADVRAPKAMHPAFYGCYDWHSCVHGYWLLARIYDREPGLPEAAEIRKLLDESLTPENIKGEVVYLDEAERKSFERTYGWAWLLKLAAQLHAGKTPEAKRWYEAVRPLAEALSARYQAFLPKQTYPIRTGVHPNTAFGLALALDYAREVGDASLEKILVSRAKDYYSEDRDAPAAWEPGGEDFLSPVLIEADLMRRVLPPKEFGVWFGAFLPKLPPNLSAPAVVGDRTDPKLVHLDGLNLSRAWAMEGIAGTLPDKHPLKAALLAAAGRHAADALAHVATGNYEGEHWLATFAVYLLTN